jgi:hypothetical protein
MAADPVVARSCGAGALVWVGLVVRFVCVIRVPVCARVCPGLPASGLSRLAPVSFYRNTTPNALPVKAVVFHSRWF